MKTTLLALIGALSLGAALPALAGPDWQIIEHGRKAKLIRLQEQAAQAQQRTAPAQPSGNNSASPQDAARKAQMIKDCQDMMKKSS